MPVFEIIHIQTSQKSQKIMLPIFHNLAKSCQVKPFTDMSALVMHPLKAQKQVMWKDDWRKSGASYADLTDESGVILTL